MKKRLVIVMGTRPEAIKLCPIVHEFRRRAGPFEPIVCATAQHREMLDQVLQTFEVEADYDLNIMAPGQTLAEVTAKATTGLDQVFRECKPDTVLVQGDTTTAFVGALVAHYHHTTVGHVEAGLRTGNKYAPFPEEMNRCLISRLADLHFAPTEHSRQVLLNEGVPPDSVFQVGNTVIDALLWTRDRVRQHTPKLPTGLDSKLDQELTVLVTGHRRESFGDGFEQICRAIQRVAQECPDVSFVYPVHLNPNVREPVHRILGELERVHLIEPLSYEPFVWLMDKATIVLTDSGGVQEEAPSLGKPVLVMRDTTERTEGIEAGTAKLVGVDQERITSELLRLLQNPSDREKMSAARNPYGDGTAAVQIAEILEEHCD